MHFESANFNLELSYSMRRVIHVKSWSDAMHASDLSTADVSLSINWCVGCKPISSIKYFAIVVEHNPYTQRCDKDAYIPCQSK